MLKGKKTEEKLMNVKNIFKKTVSAVLAAVMMCGLFGGLPKFLPETVVPMKVEASTNGHSADDAIAWCKAQVGKYLYNGQCVGLIVEYYKYLGQAMVYGNAKDYATNSLPSGWQRIAGATPQKGDVLVYTDGQYGHVAIYESESMTYHQNYNYVQYVQAIPSSQWYWKRSGYWGVIRPDFTPPEPADPLPSVSSINPGVTRIKNVGTGLMMNYGHGSSDDAMFGSPADGTPEQKFRIVSLGSNKYKIEILHANGGIVNFGVADGTSIGAGVKLSRWSTYSGDTTQQFYFRKVGTNQYVITSTKGEGVIADNSDTEARLYTQNYSSGNKDQIWELIDLEPAVTTAVTTTPKVTTTTTTTVITKKENFIRGIDVSGFQYDIDWTAVKNSGQAEFAIIRAGTTLNNDTETFYNDAKFEQNYAGAKNAGIKIGLYYYCGATTPSGFVNCAKDMVEYLDGKSAEYPVYIDVEASQAQMNMGKAVLTEYLMSALRIIKNAGYKAGVYASQSWFTSYIDKSALQSAGYEIWQARWPSATSAVDPSGYDESANCGIWQYSSKGSISGISGNVDVDVSYIDYSKTAAPTPFTPNGDINRDEAVDEVDVFLMNNHLTGKKVSDKYRKNADINGDGRINVIDLILLKRLMSNK